MERVRTLFGQEKENNENTQRRRRVGTAKEKNDDDDSTKCRVDSARVGRALEPIARTWDFPQHYERHADTRGREGRSRPLEWRGAGLRRFENRRR